MGVIPVLGDYLEEEAGVARHNTARVASDLMHLGAQPAIERKARPVAKP
jgi:hypothetical protein